MDVKSGALVGFVTALGGVAGLVFGYTAASLVDAKKPGEVAVGFGVIGGLVASFAAGTIVAPDATTATSTTTTTPTPAVGSSGIPAQLSR
jgi:hypothetical protein